MHTFRTLSLTGALLAPLVCFSANKTPPQPEVPARAKVITTPTAPIVRDNKNIFFSAEYLLMTATEANTSYARQTFPSLAFGDQKVRKCYDVEFDWNSGFRVGLGYDMGHDRWDTQVNWTWMQNHGHDRKSDSTNQLFSTNAMPSVYAESGLVADTFNSHINLHLNILDWQLGREFFLSKWLKVRPFAGLKTAWVNQTWKTTATGDIIAMNTDLTKYEVKMQQKFWGIGPMIGFNSEWGLVSHLSLYANGSFALLSGFFKDYRNDIGTQSSPVATINNPFKKSSHNAQSITELQMGLRWQQWSSCEGYRFSIQAGWDAILFAEHNHLFAINGESGVSGIGQTQHLEELGGNLMFQGLSIGLRLDF